MIRRYELLQACWAPPPDVLGSGREVCSAHICLFLNNPGQSNSLELTRSRYMSPPARVNLGNVPITGPATQLVHDLL